MFNRFRSALAAATFFLVSGSVAFATDSVMNGYPPNNVAWVTSPHGAPVSLTAAGTAIFAANGVSSARFNIAGTNGGFVGTFQCSGQLATETQVWKNISVQQAASVGGRFTNVIANGVYIGPTDGCVQVRFNLVSIVSGTTTIDATFSPAAASPVVSHERRASYSGAFAALTPAASATDILLFCGNASNTVRVTRIELNAVSTAASMDILSLVKRSTAGSGGTSSALTVVPHDASNIAAVSAPLIYTVNPTVGTLIGRLRSAPIYTNALATGATLPTSPAGFLMTFGDRWNEELTLRGTAQCIALNNEAASFTAGTSLFGSVEWTED